jgi:cold shock protein
MATGTVEWFDVRKGYGFIKPDDDGLDLLVDICALERAGMANLDRGERLSFEWTRSWRAENLSSSELQARH